MIALGSCGGGLDLHLETEITQAAEEPFGRFGFIALREKPIPQVLILDAVAQHDVRRGQRAARLAQ